MTIGTLVHDCVQDHYMTRDNEGKMAPIYYIRPRKSSEKGGQTSRVILDIGPCAHLGPLGCFLARAEMPIECISTFGCRGVAGNAGIGKQYATMLWGNARGRAIIQRFEAESIRQSPGTVMGNASLFPHLISIASKGLAGCRAVMEMMENNARYVDMQRILLEKARGR
ncbi:MAG: hypothetical protein ACTSX8_02780 [Alphaproteobacteria bacterium]